MGDKLSAQGFDAAVGLGDGKSADAYGLQTFDGYWEKTKRI